MQERRERADLPRVAPDLHDSVVLPEGQDVAGDRLVIEPRPRRHVQPALADPGRVGDAVLPLPLGHGLLRHPVADHGVPGSVGRLEQETGRGHVEVAGQVHADDAGPAGERLRRGPAAARESVPLEPLLIPAVGPDVERVAEPARELPGIGGRVLVVGRELLLGERDPHRRIRFPPDGRIGEVVVGGGRVDQPVEAGVRGRVAAVFVAHELGVLPPLVSDPVLVLAGRRDREDQAVRRGPGRVGQGRDQRVRLVGVDLVHDHGPVQAFVPVGVGRQAPEDVPVLAVFDQALGVDDLEQLRQLR